MKKKITIALSLALSSLALISCGSDEFEYSVDENKITNVNSFVDKLMEDTPSYIPAWNKESFKGRWNYIDGVFLNSIINIYKDTNDSKYKDFVINYVNYYIDNNGKFILYKDGIPTSNNNEGFTESELLDTACESKILFDLYEMTSDVKYKNAIEYTYSRLIEQPRIANGPCFYHKQRYVEQVWLDGFYMYVPFYLRYANMYNNSSIFEDVKSQYEFAYNNIRDKDTGLYYHGYDDSKSIFWADKETGCSKSIWGRGLGWFITSLTDSIEYFPDGDNKEYLKNILKEALLSVTNYEDTNSNMYYQLVDKKDEEFLVNVSYFTALKNKNYKTTTKVKNYLESSASSMFAYSLMKSSRLGYIDKEFFERGIHTFEGIYNHSYNEETYELNDICITGGLGPETSPKRDGTPAYYLAEPVGSNDAKGVGPFLMAFTEYNRLSK